MKKITTKEEEERKGRRNKIIIGVIMIGIMIVGTAGYAFYGNTGEDEEKMEYGGIEFVNENGMWRFAIQNIAFLTEFNPEETKNISVPVFVTVNEYFRAPLFFSGKGAARQEIERNLQHLVSRVQPEEVCFEIESCEEDLAIKNCEKDNIIIIKEADYIEITKEDNCVTLSSPYEEQTRVADAFLFKVLGIRGI